MNRPPGTPVPAAGAPVRRPIHPTNAHPERPLSPPSQTATSATDNGPVYQAPVVPVPSVHPYTNIPATAGHPYTSTPATAVHPYGSTPPTAGVVGGIGGRMSPAGQQYAGYPSPLNNVPHNQQIQQFPPGVTPFNTMNGIPGYPNSLPGPGLGAGYPAVDPNRRHSLGYPPIGYLNNVNHGGGYPPQPPMQNQGGYPSQFNNGYPSQMNNFNNGYPPILNNNVQNGYPPINTYGNNNMYPSINNGVGPGGLYPPAQLPMSRPASAPVGMGYPPLGYPVAASNLYPPQNVGGGGGYPLQAQAQAPTPMPYSHSPVTNVSTISTPQPTYGRSALPGAFPGSFPGAFPEMGSGNNDNSNFGMLGGHKQSINNGQATSSQPFSVVPGQYPGARSASPPELPPRK